MTLSMKEMITDELTLNGEYRIYGLTIKAESLLPGLLPATSDSIDVILDLVDDKSPIAELVPSEICETRRLDENWRYFQELNFSLWIGDSSQGRYYRFQWIDLDKEVANCYINSTGSRIVCVWSREYYNEQEAVFTNVAKRLLGWALRIRGITCLHATVVIIEGRAVALIGASGSGKSTTAAEFLAQGYSLLTDDIAALEDCGSHFRIQHGFPLLPLLPSTIEHFFQSSDNFRYVWPSSPPAPDDKRYIELKVNDTGGKNNGKWSFHAEPAQLGAIYLFEDFEQGINVPLIEPLSPARGLIALISNTYVGYILDQPARLREFERLSRLASSVPIRRLRRPRGMDRLPDIAQALVDDVSELSSSFTKELLKVTP